MSPHPALKSFLNKHQLCSRLTHPKIFCRVVKILSLTYLTRGPWKELRLSWAVVCGNDVSTSTQTATGSSVGLWCLSLLLLRLLLTGRLRQEDLQSWSQSEWHSGNPVSRRKEILVSNVMVLGGKLSLETVAFVSGICTQLKGSHFWSFPNVITEEVIGQKLGRSSPEPECTGWYWQWTSSFQDHGDCESLTLCSQAILSCQSFSLLMSVKSCVSSISSLPWPPHSVHHI